MKVKNAHGLEQLSTRHFAQTAKLLHSIMEDLKAYNDITGVKSPLFDLMINTQGEDKNLFELLLDFLPIMAELAEKYHYLKIQHMFKHPNLIHIKDSKIMYIHVEEDSNEEVLDVDYIIDDHPYTDPENLTWYVAEEGTC